MLTKDELKKVKKIQVADNFTLYEMIRSSTYPALVEMPSDKIIKHIRHFATNTLQKIRDKFGIIHVHSGYRNPILNKEVGGVKNSVHQYILDGKVLGEAADISPDFMKYSLEEVFTWVINNHKELGIKTAIIYRKPNVVKYSSRFIHLDTRRSREKFVALEKFASGDYRTYA